MEEEKNTKDIYFRIAEQLIHLEVPEEIDVQKCLPSFRSFVEHMHQEDEESIFIKLDLHHPPNDYQNMTILSDINTYFDSRFRFEESDCRYITTVETFSTLGSWKMHSSKDFKSSTIYIFEQELYSTSILTWLLMIVFGQAALFYETVLIHASVVEKEGEGYAFLGKSGTGKSTHSQLWIKNKDNVSLLNDDNPAIRILPDGRIKVYGTPWSGKTVCYQNRGVPLRGVVRLEQAQSNRFRKCLGTEALLTILPSCTAIRWNRELFGKMINHLESIIKKVTVGKLECLANKAAVDTCFDGVTDRKNN